MINDSMLNKNFQAQNVKGRNKLKLLLGIAVIILISFIFIIVLQIGGNTSVIEREKESLAADVNPTPMPFEEMTIPYLRKREYKSSLSKPMLLENAGSYKKFLANYNSDGYKINALLTIPTEDMPIEGFPAIVFVHGYIPPTLYETNGSSYSSYVDYLAKSGFVVLKIDLRGHGNSEGEPGGGYYGSDYIADTLNAYTALQTSDFVNPSKVGLWGHSMAGNILLRSFAVKPNIPAVNIWAGAVFTYSDRLKYGINDNSYRPPTTANETRRRRTELINKYGEYSEKSEFWQKVAPTNYLKDIKGAMQLDHAVDDATVNIGYSQDLAALLKANNVNYVLNEYSSGGHDIEGVNFTKAMQNTVDFFNKYLKD